MLYRDRFTRDDVPDHVWLPKVIGEGLVVLTHDHAMRADLEAKSAVYEKGGAVFIVRGNWTHAKRGEIVVRAAPAIGRFLARHPPPLVAAIRLQMSGTEESVAVVSLLSADDPLSKWRGDRKTGGAESFDIEKTE